MNTCCIIGHRDFEKTKELELKVKSIVADLIEKENVTDFLFGSKSKFIDFCYDIVTEYKNTYSNLKRIFVRAEYPIISDDYYNYLKTFYEDSYFYSEKLITNRFSYIRRNQVMIDKSNFCIFYFNSNYRPKRKRQSGTHIAYEYAIKKGKEILNVLSYKL
ncbi:MAG: hypothetical protein IKC91_05055 [Clostridia bacterium]|nr:hypothetical protein [Clostridia bacterium]